MQPRPLRSALLPILAAACLAGGVAPALGITAVRVVATGIKTDQGKVCVWVYDKKDDWLSDRYRTQKCVAVAGNRQGDRLTLELELPAGEYALSVFQDENDDGKLQSNFLGIPKEPAGLSNNVRPRFGPPKYRDATFKLAPGEIVEQKIALQ